MPTPEEQARITIDQRLWNYCNVLRDDGVSIVPDTCNQEKP